MKSGYIGCIINCFRYSHYTKIGVFIDLVENAAIKQMVYSLSLLFYLPIPNFILEPISLKFIVWKFLYYIINDILYR